MAKRGAGPNTYVDKKGNEFKIWRHDNTMPGAVGVQSQNKNWFVDDETVTHGVDPEVYDFLNRGKPSHREIPTISPEEEDRIRDQYGDNADRIIDAGGRVGFDPKVDPPSFADRKDQTRKWVTDRQSEKNYELEREIKRSEDARLKREAERRKDGWKGPRDDWSLEDWTAAGDWVDSGRSLDDFPGAPAGVGVGFGPGTVRGSGTSGPPVKAEDEAFKKEVEASQERAEKHRGPEREFGTLTPEELEMERKAMGGSRRKPQPLSQAITMPEWKRLADAGDPEALAHIAAIGDASLDLVLPKDTTPKTQDTRSDSYMQRIAMNQGTAPGGPAIPGLPSQTITSMTAPLRMGTSPVPPVNPGLPKDTRSDSYMQRIAMNQQPRDEEEAGEARTGIDLSNIPADAQAEYAKLLRTASKEYQKTREKELMGEAVRLSSVTNLLREYVNVVDTLNEQIAGIHPNPLMPPDTGITDRKPKEEEEEAQPEAQPDPEKEKKRQERREKAREAERERDLARLARLKQDYPIGAEYRTAKYAGAPDSKGRTRFQKARKAHRLRVFDMEQRLRDKYGDDVLGSKKDDKKSDGSETAAEPLFTGTLSPGAAQALGSIVDTLGAEVLPGQGLFDDDSALNPLEPTWANVLFPQTLGWKAILAPWEIGYNALFGDRQDKSQQQGAVDSTSPSHAPAVTPGQMVAPRKKTNDQ